jgi:hypothetical protein
MIHRLDLLVNEEDAMTNPQPDAGLQIVSEFASPVHCSRGLEAHAHTLAARFQRAHAFFSTLFGISPSVGLVVLSADDWPTYARASFPIYGFTHYFDAQVVTGGPDTTFWQSFVDTITTASPHLVPELRTVYGRPDGRITLTPHIEWWIVHDLGHAFHAHLSYWFPRKWLMELFADLCLYTYVAANEPDYLPRLETVLRLLHQLPAAHFRYHTLHDFDTQYLNMELVNYVWYHGHFFACAKLVYDAAGRSALDRLWRLLVIPNVREVTDTELAALLQDGQPELAQLMQTWPP